MNIIELQEKLKDIPDQRLTQEMQSPSGSVPQFLVLNELNRRKRMRDDMKAMSAQPTATVAQEAIASAGVPAGGIAAMAQMAPRSSIAQNTGIASVAPQPMPADQSIAQGMYRGGMVRRMYGGGPVRRMQQGGPTSQPVIVRSGITYYLQPDGTYVSSSGDRTLSDVGTNLRNVIPDIKENIGRITAPSPQATQSFDPSAAPVFGQAPAGALPMRFGYMPPNRQVDAMIPDLSDVAAAMPSGGPGTFPVPEMGRTAADDLAIRRRLFSSETPPEAQQGIGGLPGYVPPTSGGASGDMALRANLSGGDGQTPTEIFRETVDRRDLESVMRDQSTPAAPRVAPTMMPQIPNDPGMAIPRVGGPVAQVGSTEAPVINPVLLAGSGGVGIDAVMPPMPSRSTGMNYIPDPLARSSGPAGMPMTSRGPAAMAAPPPAPAAPFITPEMAAGVRDAFESPVSAALSGLPFPLADASFSEAAPAIQTAPPPAVPMPTTPDVASTPAAGIPALMPTPAPSEMAESGVAARSASGAASTVPPSAPASQQAAATSYEQELINAIQRQEQRAEQDKWLALAQVGLGMMTSRSPTFLGAVGEGGAAGVQALMGARNANEDRRMELVQALEEYRMMQADRAAAARAAAARQAAGGRGSASSAPSLSNLQGRRGALVTSVEDPMTGEDREVPIPGYEDEVMYLDSLIAQAAMAGLPQMPAANLADVVQQ